MKRPVLTALAILAVGSVALLPISELRSALFDSDQELAGECKVVYVNGEPDHCIVVIPGTDTPVSLPSRH